MKYIRNTTDFYIEENTVLSLGKFDGIHRGHEQLLQYFAKKKDEGLAGAILPSTFHLAEMCRMWRRRC